MSGKKSGHPNNWPIEKCTILIHSISYTYLCCVVLPSSPFSKEYRSFRVPEDSFGSLELPLGPMGFLTLQYNHVICTRLGDWKGFQSYSKSGLQVKSMQVLFSEKGTKNSSHTDIQILWNLMISSSQICLLDWGGMLLGA